MSYWNWLNIVLSIFLYTQNLLADDRFESLRNDQLIPEHCHNVKLSDFSDEISYFTMSIKDSKQNGFDYEHPIDRRTATNIWRKALGAKAWSQESIQGNNAHETTPNQDYYQSLIAHAPLMDFNLSSEGEVLEILGTLLLYDLIADDKTFITGSIAYRLQLHSRYIGELDFIIADKTTCQIYAVGEAKLNKRKHGYAKQQLNRFQNFLLEQRRIQNFWRAPKLFVIGNS
ncbi:MAG: hypothetical protein KDD40_08670 [Bdellovibrionales bacterium]|nr:hypothetical protein [Bdellovibrionales bacterium]